MESPFITHREKVLGHYGTASWLRQLVLAMWNGSRYPTGLSKLTGLDSEHANAVFEMLASYRKNGENDRAFMALADECRARLEEEQAAEKRAHELDRWMGDLRYLLPTVGLRAGLCDDRYSWFEARFDEGIDVAEAVKKAAQAKLD